MDKQKTRVNTSGAAFLSLATQYTLSMKWSYVAVLCVMVVGKWMQCRLELMMVFIWRIIELPLRATFTGWAPTVLFGQAAIRG